MILYIYIIYFESSLLYTVYYVILALSSLSKQLWNMPDNSSTTTALFEKSNKSVKTTHLPIKYQTPYTTLWKKKIHNVSCL